MNPFLKSLADAFVDLYARTSALESLVAETKDRAAIDAAIQAERIRLGRLPTIAALLTRHDETQVSTVLETLKSVRPQKL